MAVLDEILAATRSNLPAVRVRIDELRRAAATRVPPPDFRAALRRDQVAVIAEIKRRSPSAGAINVALDPTRLAEHYAEAGAAAISVLTNETHFGGSIHDLERVTATTSLPVLRKDFILEEVQLIEARASGAAAALLIVRALAQSELERLIRLAAEHELTALVEAHTAEEVARALDAGGEVIGVNARDLDDFSVNVDRALELVSRLPREVVAVAESAMATAEDVERAAAAGADAVLVGGALAGAGDPGPLLREMAGIRRRGR